MLKCYTDYLTYGVFHQEESFHLQGTFPNKDSPQGFFPAARVTRITYSWALSEYHEDLVTTCQTARSHYQQVLLPLIIMTARFHDYNVAFD